MRYYYCVVQPQPNSEGDAIQDFAHAVPMRVRTACRVERILVFDLTPTCKPLSFDCIEKPSTSARPLSSAHGSSQASRSHP